MYDDLDYFYEFDLNRTDLLEYYNCLPSRLRDKFAASLHVTISAGNTLQGYRGPYHMCNGRSGDSQELKPSHGLQEIQFWWGARKDINFIPIAGTVAYTLGRASQKLRGELEWSSLYFDNKTGKCLSHDKRVAAEKLKSRARKAKSKSQASRSSYDSDDDNEHREESYDNMMEAEAEALNFQGDESFDRGNYIRARDKYEEALHSSKERGPRRTYMRNLHKAQGEIDAKERFREGNRLFMLGRYEEAEAEYQAAYNISDVNDERRIYGEYAERASIEKFAMLYNSEGNDLFHRGRFEDAISSYELAIGISQVDKRIRIYRTNVANAHNEIHAVNLNSQGNDLFNQCRFREALSEYQSACQKSQVAVQIEKYRFNIAKAQIEVHALELNSEGHNFLSENKYDDVIRMYQEAYAESKVSAQRQIYESNADRAKAEAEADILNYRGNNLFKEGKYHAALSKYQLAANTSQRNARIQIYRDNVAKAQVEIDALNLNSQGDSFFNLGRYNDAVSTYLAAYSKSQIATPKNVYLSNKNKAQDVINKLNTLDTLWERAWYVENDTKTDQSGEAKDLFQNILSESEENLKTFPGNSKFEQYNILAVLKIEGNDIFNQGLEPQQKGIILLRAAEELNQQEKYELANEKFKDAKKYFQNALEKYEEGSKSDHRFAPCVEFVQEQINEVIQSMELCEQRMLSAGLQELDIHFDSDTQRSDTDIGKVNEIGNHKQYSQYI